jgi:predicted methyltransferase
MNTPAPASLLLLAAALFAGGCGGPSTEAGPAEGPGGAQATAPTKTDTSTAPGAQGVEVPAAVRAAVDAPDRSEADKKLDAGRRPAELLAFFGMKEGMKVAELGAGTGYTAELLARVVGPSGAVFGQNSKFLLERFAEKPWSERLAKPVMKNVVRVDREFDDPLPPEAKNLDVVFMVLFYHDTIWMGTDRPRMLRSIFTALKPGGAFAVVDHAGRDGTGVTEVQTLHRIEEKVLKDEIQAAGFRLEGEGSFLRNPSDKRDWNASPMSAGEQRGMSDRFVLKFVKPGQLGSDAGKSPVNSIELKVK